ncbi:MAG: TlyA family RNA methyltransferase [Thermodesulfobacteriota bacterium]
MDTLLVERGLAESRERAHALVIARRVLVNGEIGLKPGRLVPATAHLAVAEDLPYVSRGGIKLAGALDDFGIDPTGLTVLDAGASTGGFTDCLLQRGAARVLAVDVGYGQFHWRLRQDSRVTLLERTNFRYLDVRSLPFDVDAGVADLSFISLELILPVCARIIPDGGWLVPLVKPQFELSRKDVAGSGVVTDPDKMAAAVEKIKKAADRSGFEVLSQTESPLTGPKGNREFFLHLVKVKAQYTAKGLRGLNPS